MTTHRQAEAKSTSTPIPAMSPAHSGLLPQQEQEESHRSVVPSEDRLRSPSAPTPPLPNPSMGHSFGTIAIGPTTSPVLQRAAISHHTIQRQENSEKEEKPEEEPIQAKAIAPSTDLVLQRQENLEDEEKEEEPIQTKKIAPFLSPLLQRQEIAEEAEKDDEAEPLQAKAMLGQELTHFSQGYGQRVIETGIRKTPKVPILQRKLTIGQPNDQYEQEADHVADQVMRTPERSQEDETKAVQTQSLAPSITPLVQRQAGQEELEEDIQTKGSTVPTVTLSLETQLQEQQGKGQPLPEKTRSFMESRFGRDFSGVRVHTDSNAEQMNRELKAQAFTHQNDVYFGTGKYNPESEEGKRLLAHELTHTVQQGGSTVHPQYQTEQQTEEPKEQDSETGTPNIQAAWYNFDIPFTDYQFDPSIEGIKTAANIAKETVEEGFEWFFDKIKNLVSAGIEWISEKWSSIQKFALSGFETIKSSFTNIIRFIKSPLSYIADAVISFSAESLATAWATFKGIVTKVWEGFKALTGNLLQSINNIWGTISGYATSLLNKVTGLTQNYLFKKLPNALQQMAYSLINRINNLWKSINDGWTKLFNRIKTWIDSALDTVLQFVRRVISFGINVVIDGIRQFGKLVLFLKDLFTNPRKYVDILAKKSVKAFEGVESHFASIVSKYFGDSKAATPTANITGTIQRQPSTNSAPEAKSSASWGEIGHGIWEMMGKKWQEFKSNPWSVVTTLLLDMVLPIVGNVKDIIQLFKDIKKIVTAPFSAGSLEELWTSFLQILEIPILIYHTIVSILMRTLTLPLIVASFIPHPLVKAIAAAVGYGLLGAFVQVELVNIGHKLLLLKTGAITKNQKEEAYNRIADSFIALAMTAVIIVIMIILHFLAQVVKGVYNFVKGKIFSVKEPPVELKSGSQEGKGIPEEGKGSKSGEAPKLEGEVASRDGQRSIKVTEKGKIWICASPCEEIRLKYEAQIKDNPTLNERIKALEEGYSELSPEQKSLRDTQIKQLEQELADLKLAQEGGVRVPKEVKWPPEPPKGNKPSIDAPNAAEWRYQRYVYEKFQKGATPKDVLPPDEWMRRYFDPSAEGGRPGRPGGPEQVAAKKELAAEGIRIVENVELGGRYPDGIDPKPNPAGGRSYFEVGKMLESGIPEARERVKIADEIKAMGPNDTVTFVDKTNVKRRVTYAKGSTSENPTSRTFQPGKD